MSATSNYKIWVEGKLKTDTLQKQLNDFQKKIKDIKIKVNVTGNTQLKDTNTQLKDMPANTEMAQRGVYKLATEFNNLKSTALGLYATLKGLTQPVFELDTSMTEFKKVSDLSGSSLDNFVDKAKTVRAEVGRTTSEMIDATTEFKKSGFTEDESLELAKVASIYQNVADSEVSAGDAATFVTSQLKAFNINADDAISVVDKVNEVSNNFAVSSTDIASALSKTSAAMATYGNSMDETIGLVTAGTEIMTDQGDKVARGLRTIGANILGFAENNRTLEYTVNGVKESISFFDDAGAIKNTYQILSDIAQNWKNMSTEEQSALGLQLAGKNQFEVFSSVLLNFSQAQKAVETSSQSMGSAEKENEAVMESLATKVNDLKAAWQDFVTHIIESGVVSDVLESVTKALEKLTEIDPNIIKGIVTALIGSKVLSSVKIKFPINNKELKTTAKLLNKILKFLGANGLIAAGAIAAFGVISYKILNVIDPSVETLNNKFNDTKDLLDTVNEEMSKETEPVLLKAYQKQAEKLNEKLDEITQKKLDTIWGDDDAGIVGSLLGRRAGDIQEVLTAYETTKNAIKDFGLDEELLKNLNNSKKQIEEFINTTVDLMNEGAKVSGEQMSKINEAFQLIKPGVDFATYWMNQFKNTLITEVTEGQINFTDAITKISNAKLDFKQQLEVLGELQVAFGQTTAEGIALAQFLSDLYSLTDTYANMKTPYTLPGGSVYLQDTFGSRAMAEQKALETLMKRYQSGAYKAPTVGTTSTDDETKTGNITSGTTTGASTGASSKTVDPIKEENDAYKENIEILEHRIEMMKRNGATEEELIAEYEKMKNIVHEQAEKYRAMGLDENSEYIRDLQNQWWGYVDDIQDLYDEMDKKRKEALEKQRDETQEYLDALQVYADEQAEKLEKEKAAQDKIFDERIKRLQAERDALDEQNEALEEQNKLKELQQKLDSAKEKRIQVYHEGVGFTWDEDTEAIQEAQSDLEEEQRQQALKQQKAAIDEKISLIEQEKEDVDDYYDEQIDAWRNFSTEYSNIENRVKARQILAKRNEKQNLDERLGNFESFKDDYIRAANELIQINNSLGESNINPSDVISSLIQAGVITGDWFKNATKSTETHASGTVRFKGGLTSINENGAEMLIPPSLNTLANLPTGTGIVPHNVTQNLMELGKYSLNGLKRLLGGGTSYNFSGTTFSFPNMTNNSSINQFIKDLSTFENSAIQSSYSRI